MNRQLSTLALLAPDREQLPFVDKLSDTMHIDVNSCFASIEQQCNSLLRGKPVAVAAYASPRGCILSPSVEAKRFGIKTGMRVLEGKRLCPDLIVLSPDPWKYRWVNQQLNRLFRSYTPQMEMKSIDEAVLHFVQLATHDSRLTVGKSVNGQQSTANDQSSRDLFDVGVEIKARIKREIGDWLRVSIGIGPNRFLAKTAAGLHKPDGLEEINWWNIESVLTGMELEDLNGISGGNSRRLRTAGLLTPMDLYRADIPTLRRAFRSILGFSWHLKLRGYEVDDRPYVRQSFSHMYSLPKPARTPEELGAVVSKLVHSLGYRMRRSGYRARGLYVSVMDHRYQGWTRHHLGDQMLYHTADLYRQLMRLVAEQVAERGWQPVYKVFVGCFALERSSMVQTTLFHDEVKKRRLVEAMDAIHATYGKYALVPARSLQVHGVKRVPDFVAFGGVKELEELPFEEAVHVEEDFEQIHALEAGIDI